MSRLGGAAGMAPLVASMSSEGNNKGSSSTSGGAKGNDAATKGGNGENGGAGGGGLRATENQVAKMIGEDMGTAMQYLQGKGLCLMPISLASAMSSTTSSASFLSRLPVRHPAAAAGVQLPDGNGTSANGAGGGDDARPPVSDGVGMQQ
jgi:hypothetical protein